MSFDLFTGPGLVEQAQPCLKIMYHIWLKIYTGLQVYWLWGGRVLGGFSREIPLRRPISQEEGRFLWAMIFIHVMGARFMTKNRNINFPSLFGATTA